MAVDHVVEFLNKKGIPLTRENYLALSHPGWDPNKPLHPAVEMDLPEEIQMTEYDPDDNPDFDIDDVDF